MCRFLWFILNPWHCYSRAKMPIRKANLFNEYKKVWWNRKKYWIIPNNEMILLEAKKKRIIIGILISLCTFNQVQLHLRTITLDRYEFYQFHFGRINFIWRKFDWTLVPKYSNLYFTHRNSESTIRWRQRKKKFLNVCKSDDEKF